MNVSVLVKDLLAKRPRTVAISCAAVAALLVYANSLTNGFAFDDLWIVRDRQLLHDIGRLWEIITAKYWPITFHAGLYRPLTLLSFAVDWAVWNGHPFGFHLANVLLHALVSALVVALLLRFFPWWAALAGGLVFAIHPVHTEAVANVVGRGEIFMALFSLAACLVYVRAVRGEGLTARAVALIAMFYALACLSKETGVVLPALLLATDLKSPRGTGPRPGAEYARTRVPLLVVLVLVLVAVFALRWAVLGSAVKSVPGPVFEVDSSFTTRLFTMSRIWPRYLELLLLPFQLSADYDPAVTLPASHLTPLGLAGFAVVLGILATAIAVVRRAPELTMAVLWAAVTLLPVSNLVITSEIVLAERAFYLPSVAVSIVTALLLTRARPERRRLAALAVALWIVGFSVVTVRRNPVWNSTFSVFRDLQRHHPESVRLLFGVATQAYRMGDWEESKKWFDTALEIWPHHPTILVAYGHTLSQEGELDAADAMLERALTYRPEEREYHRLLASYRVQAEKWESALEAIHRAYDTIGPDRILYGLEADAYTGLGKFPEAARAQEAVIVVYGDDAPWHERLQLAELHAAAGDTAAALAALDWARQAEAAQFEVADSLQEAWGVPR